MKTIRFENGGIPQTAFDALTAYLNGYLRDRSVSEGVDYTVTVTATGERGNDRFSLRPQKGGVLVAGTSLSSAFHGVGVLLRKLRFDGRGNFTPLAEPFELTPEKPLRGMYFATHFNNFYHNAPPEKVYERILLCALRGYNELLVWFDMHHYRSMEDPAAAQMVERLRSMIAFANRIGMGASMLHLANEAFDSSPEPLRAHFRMENGYRKIPLGNYKREICPSAEGGIAEILKERREMLAAFADLQIDYVIYWPYDQGGCTCEKCAPWGANGFLKLLPHYRKLIAEVVPNAKLILSCWMFDAFTDGEWAGFDAAFARGELSDAAYVMAGKIPHDLPHVKEIKWISFPEISMMKCIPWGGFGASQLADTLTERIGGDRDLIAGGFPYSEGIFEDANEFMIAAWYTGEFSSNREALRAYVAETFCNEDEELFRAVEETETGLKRGIEHPDDRMGVRYPIADPSRVESVAKTFAEYAKILPERIANSPAFRLFFLRSVIDEEMLANDFVPMNSPRCIEAMDEVDRLYYADDDTIVWVRTPAWRAHPGVNPTDPAV